jgi:hypothetical protein
MALLHDALISAIVKPKAMLSCLFISFLSVHRHGDAVTIVAKPFEVAAHVHRAGLIARWIRAVVDVAVASRVIM